MENHRIEELRAELDLLFKKQTEVLELRTFGGASDAVKQLSQAKVSESESPLSKRV